MPVWLSSPLTGFRSPYDGDDQKYAVDYGERDETQHDV